MQARALRLGRLGRLLIRRAAGALAHQAPLLAAEARALADAEAVAEDELDLLEAEAGGLGEAREAEEPAEEAEARVEAERARGRDRVHEGEVRRADEQVARPVRRRRERRAEPAHVEREELALLPGHVPEARRVGGDVEDHREEDDGGPGMRVRGAVDELATCLAGEDYRAARARIQLASDEAFSEKVCVQWKATLARTRPTIIPGADQIMIFRLPMISMYLRATRVKMKLVPETMRPTAVGWLNPISLKRVASRPHLNYEYLGVEPQCLPL